MTTAREDREPRLRGGTQERTMTPDDRKECVAMLRDNVVGVRATCGMCGQTKCPAGRSAPMGASYCDHECPGYWHEPIPGSLWPGESEAAFGYRVADVGTTTLTLAADEIEKGADDAR